MGKRIKNKKGKKRVKKEKKKDIEEFDLEEKESLIHPEVKKSVFGIVSFLLALILIFSYFDKAGVAGQYIKSAFVWLLGIGFFIIPLTFLMISFAFFKSLKTNIYYNVFLGGVMFLLSFLGLLDVLSRMVNDQNIRSAGELGFLIAYPFYHLFGGILSIFIFISFILISIILSFNISLKIPSFKFLKNNKEDEDEFLDKEEDEEYKEELEEEESQDDSLERSKNTAKEFVEKALVASKKVKSSIKKEKSKSKSNYKKNDPSKVVADFVVETHQRSYKLPPLDLLDKSKHSPLSGDVKMSAETIKRTLKHFGIDVEMGEVNIGPTVTQYTLKPAQGVKLSKIVALQNDLALALAAHPLRIEAPIPGKSLVGIEIPNKVVAVVKLRELIDTPEFWESSPLTVALGKDVSGNYKYADIEKMPHLLIAGATGSGKSVTLHSILTSLLYKNFPQMLKFLMVDPKRVELSAYNGIPHLLAPVITQRSKAIAALNWAIKEMDRRYEMLAEHNARNITSYNAKVASKDGKILPYIVIVIDELADLMTESPREIEAGIVRLAQMARAVGIHLILSTQRPSVDVITGLIKANIPCRIALQVASVVDSRTILDISGAEKLLGNGDMLYLPKDSTRPIRIQSAFISEKEVKKITDYLRNKAMIDEEDEEEYKDELKEELNKRKTTIDMGIDLEEFEKSARHDDPLFEEAKNIVIEAQKASTSFLQRRLKIGYSRAARLMDILEEEGIIGPANGSKPREVYVSKEDIREEKESDE